jgi:hypothetical protein
MKITLVGAELSLAEGWTNGTTELTVAFPNFVNEHRVIGIFLNKCKLFLLLLFSLALQLSAGYGLLVHQVS